MENDPSKKHLTEVHAGHVEARLVAEKTVGFLLKDMVENPEALKRAESLINKGMGLAFVLPHPSQHETQGIISVLMSVKSFRDRSFAYYIAEHHKNLLVDIPAFLTNAHPQYVTTEESVRKAEKKVIKKLARIANEEKPAPWNIAPRSIDIKIPEKNTGLAEATNNILDVLSAGGITMIFPQGTRRAQLYDIENEPTLSRFMAQAKRRNIEFGVVFVGFDAPSISDFSINKGMNIGKKYIYKIGNTYTSSELLEKAGTLRNVDNLVYEELAEIVPKNYRNKPFKKANRA